MLSAYASVHSEVDGLITQAKARAKENNALIQGQSQAITATDARLPLFQAVLREHNETSKQTLMNHVIELREEAGLGATEVQRPLSLMDHIIALRAEVQELRQQLSQE